MFAVGDTMAVFVQSFNLTLGSRTPMGFYRLFRLLFNRCLLRVTQMGYDLYGGLPISDNQQTAIFYPSVMKPSYWLTNCLKERPVSGFDCFQSYPVSTTLKHLPFYSFAAKRYA